MSSGRVTHGEHEGVHVLRYFGRVGYAIAPSIRKFAEALLETPTFKALVFDLTEAENLDSTNLGLLVRLGLKARAKGRQALVVPGAQELREMLCALSIDRILDVTNERPDFSENGVIHAASTDKRSLHADILQAHRTLMTLSQDNEDRFRDVVVFLEAEAGEDAGRPVTPLVRAS